MSIKELIDEMSNEIATADKMVHDIKDGQFDPSPIENCLNNILELVKKVSTFAEKPENVDELQSFSKKLEDNLKKVDEIKDLLESKGESINVSEE